MALGLSPQEIIDKGEYQLLAKAPHWERVFVADVADVQNGCAFKSELFDRDDGVPLIRIRDISRYETEHRYRGEYDDSYLVDRDDILIGMDGEFVASRWKGAKALLNQRVCKLVVRSPNFDEKFFFLCHQPFLSAINAETSSVTVKHLSSRTIETIPLPLPPLKEQRRIVAEIEALFSELDNGIENLNTVRQQLKIYRLALLKSAFEGKITAQWREQNTELLDSGVDLLKRLNHERDARYQIERREGEASNAWEASGRHGRRPSRPTRPTEIVPIETIDDVDLPELPYGWLWVRYGDLCALVRNGISGKPEGTRGTKIFRISAVRPMEFDLADCRYLKNPDGQYDSYYLASGDLVFTRYNGSRGYVGVCAEYRGNGEHLFPDKLIQNTPFVTAD
jgi:type I restriction enzyme S subunit